MSQRAFPVVFAQHVTSTALFYERLGFHRTFELPPDTDEPGYVGLARDGSEVAVVDASWPEQQYARRWASGVRFEMFVYVDDVDAVVTNLRTQDVVILRDPANMPWGERVAYVTDPDGNPVALAT